MQNNFETKVSYGSGFEERPFSLITFSRVGSSNQFPHFGQQIRTPV